MGKREENLRKKLKDNEEIQGICDADSRRQRQMHLKFRRAIEQAVARLDLEEKRSEALYEAAWDARNEHHQRSGS